MTALITIRNYLLLAAVLAVLAAIPLSERLDFDQRIEAFFADDNPDLQLLRRSRRVFGGDEFVIVAWSEPRLFRIDVEPYPDSLSDVLKTDALLKVDDVAAARIRSVAAKLNEIPGVNGEKTQHLADLLDAGPRYKPARRSMAELFEGTLVGRDGRTTGIMLELLPEARSSIPRGDTLARIRRVADELSGRIEGDVAVAGEPVQVYDMFVLVEEDSRELFLVSLVILSTVLLLMFRGLRWLLAPVGLVLGSVVLTRATLVLVGAELSMVSSMLSSLVTVIGIATCMHVIVHYRDLRNAAAGGEVEDDASTSAVRRGIAAQTLKEMAAPIFWTCVTTAVGFGSLLVSQITPVRSFSVMMCLATGVVLVACLMVLPATLASGSRLRVPSSVPMEHWLDNLLNLTCRTVERRPVSTGILCLMLFAVAIPGVFRLTLETDFSRNFRESSTIVQALRFVETRLGGAGSWEVAFDTPPELTDDFLEDINQLTEELRELTADEASFHVLSLTDLVYLPPRVGAATTRLSKIQRKQPLLISSLYNQEQQRMRIVLRSAEQQPSEQKMALIARIRDRVQEFFANHTELEQQTPPSASGMFVLLASLIESLLSDQLKSFIVASAGILLCMTISFRSLRIGLISLLPNIFPVALVMGILGWIGMRVNIGTAMIASVSMGLTVDSTIHYITAFERARRVHSVTEALQTAHAGAGRAVIFAHLALVAGFLVLTASRFIPLVYFGALLTLSLIGGVFGDLVLLPLLLRWIPVGKERAKPS
ncbi:MAG: MMPL family transporter [Fuerstiella sp.]